MRHFTVVTPVKEGVVMVDDVSIGLTLADARDLNRGWSITTLTTMGEEVAVFPEESRSYRFYMVLDDGETFTALAGCKIVALPEDFPPEDVDEAIKRESAPVNVVTIFN